MPYEHKLTEFFAHDPFFKNFIYECNLHREITYEHVTNFESAIHLLRTSRSVNEHNQSLLVCVRLMLQNPQKSFVQFLIDNILDYEPFYALMGCVLPMGKITLDMFVPQKLQTFLSQTSPCFVAWFADKYASKIKGKLKKTWLEKHSKKHHCSDPHTQYDHVCPNLKLTPATIFQQLELPCN